MLRRECQAPFRVELRHIDFANREQRQRDHTPLRMLRQPRQRDSVVAIAELAPRRPRRGIMMHTGSFDMPPVTLLRRVINGQRDPPARPRIELLDHESQHHRRHLPRLPTDADQRVVKPIPIMMIPTELRVGRTVAVVRTPWSGRGLESQRIQRLSCARSRPDQGVWTTTAGSVGNGNHRALSPQRTTNWPSADRPRATSPPRGSPAESSSAHRAPRPSSPPPPPTHRPAETWRARCAAARNWLVPAAAAGHAARTWTACAAVAVATTVSYAEPPLALPMKCCLNNGQPRREPRFFKSQSPPSRQSQFA